MYPSTYNPTFKIFYNDKHFIIDKVFYGIKPNNNIDPLLLLAVLNSSITQLFIEVTGYALAGGGGLFYSVVDLENLKILDINQIDNETKEKLKKIIKKL